MSAGKLSSYSGVASTLGASNTAKTAYNPLDGYSTLGGSVG